MQFAREVAVARQAAQVAADIVARHCQAERQSWNKADDSPVTQADLEANAAICQTLARAFPDDAILSEETTDTPQRLARERLWVIDPIDGTKEFIAGVAEFAVSIGFALRGQPVVGVVHQPLTGECFWGTRGGGAWLGSQRLRVSTLTELSRACLLSSRSETRRGQVDVWAGHFERTRVVGSAAFKLAMIAANRADVWLSTAPKHEWDVCAGDLLVREAGGSFITLAEGPRVYNQANVRLSPLMAAGPPALLAALGAIAAKAPPDR